MFKQLFSNRSIRGVGGGDKLIAKGETSRNISHIFGQSTSERPSIKAKIFFTDQQHNLTYYMN